MTIREEKKGRYWLQYHSIPRQELNRETAKHPDLAPLLASYAADDFAGRIGEIAAYCGIIMDGYYDAEQLDKACIVLIYELKSKRAAIASSSPIILPPPRGIQ